MFVHAGEFTKALVAEITIDQASKVFEEALLATLVSLNIVAPSDQLLEYREIHGWERGGAETYIASANLSIVDSAGLKVDKRFIAKAIVTFGLPLSLVIEKWLDRSQRLALHKIRIPQLYSSRDGVIYEQFILRDLRNSVGLPGYRWGMIESLGRLVASLDIAGFHPVNIIGNLRWDNCGVLYWVDFGSDLGEYSDTPVDAARQVLYNELSLTEQEVIRLNKEYDYRFHYM